MERPVWLELAGRGERARSGGEALSRDEDRRIESQEAEMPLEILSRGITCSALGFTFGPGIWSRFLRASLKSTIPTGQVCVHKATRPEASKHSGLSRTPPPPGAPPHT